MSIVNCAASRSVHGLHASELVGRQLLDETPHGPFVVVFIGSAGDRAADDAQRAFVSRSDNTA